MRNVTAENVAEVAAMARAEKSSQHCEALLSYCEGFALRALPAEGAVAVLAGLPGGAGSLRSALRPDWALLGEWPAG